LHSNKYYRNDQYHKQREYNGSESSEYLFVSKLGICIAVYVRCRHLSSWTNGSPQFSA